MAIQPRHVAISVLALMGLAAYVVLAPSPEERRFQEGLVVLPVHVAVATYADAHQGLHPPMDGFAAAIGTVRLPRTQPYVNVWQPADVVTIPWADRDRALGKGHYYDGKAFDRATYGAIVYSCSPDRKDYVLFGVAEKDGQAVPEFGPP